MKSKIIINILIVLFIIIIMEVIVHESGHILFCIASGGKFIGSGTKDSSVGMVIYVENQYPNKTSRIIGCIGGNLFQCCIALIMCIISWKKRKIPLFFGFSLSFFSATFYWGLSPLIKLGDGYNFCVATGFNFLVISIIFFILCGINYIILCYSWFKLLDLRDVG